MTFQNKNEKCFFNQLAHLWGHTTKKPRYWHGMKHETSPVYVMEVFSKWCKYFGNCGKGLILSKIRGFRLKKVHFRNKGLINIDVSVL